MTCTSKSRIIIVILVKVVDYARGNTNLKGKDLKAKDLIRLLNSKGWQFHRQRGSHKIFKKNGKILPIPCHNNLEIPLGTLKNILKTADIDQY